MAPSLLALPAELKIHIFSFVDLTDAEFAPLRFLCRTLLPMTTAERFRTFDIDTSEKSRERLHELMHKRCMVSGTSFHEWVKVLQIHEGVLEPARQDREEGGPDVAAADATEVPASLDKALDSSSTTNREHEEIEHAETPVLAGDRASNPNNENDEVKTQLMLASIDLGKVKEGEAPVIDHIAVQEKPEIGSNTAKDSPGRQETVVEETLQDNNEGPASTEHLDDGDNDKASEQGQNQGDDEAATGVDNTANASGNEQQPLEESAQLTMGIDGVLAEVESLRAVTKITLIFSSDSLDTQQVFGAKIFERIHHLTMSNLKALECRNLTGGPPWTKPVSGAVRKLWQSLETAKFQLGEYAHCSCPNFHRPHWNNDPSVDHRRLWMEHLDPQKLEVLSVTSNGFPFVRMPPLENLHLRVLKLDSYLFIHQTQLATMLAHTITLEELEMLTCSMTLYVAVREGSENLSELNTWAEHAIGFVPQLEDIQPHQKAPILRGWINRSQRWHHLFHDLPTLLPKLKRFVWDTTQPYDVTANHFRIPWSSGCMCTAPKDLNIPPDTPVFAGLEADDERDTFPEFCRKEDDAAFEKLKDILSLRKSGGAHSSTDASDEEPI